MKTRSAVIILALFFCIQLGQSLFQVNTWPFLSYSMFTQKFDYRDEVVLIKVHYKDGQERFLSPWNHMPLEIFKSLNLLKKMFLQPDPILKGKRREVAALILKSLKDPHITALGFYAINLKQETFHSLKEKAIKGRELFHFEKGETL